MWIGLGSFIRRHLQTAWSYLYDIIKTIPPRVSLQENKYFIEMCTIKKRNVTSLRRLDPIVMSLDLKEEVKLCMNNSPWRSLDVSGVGDEIPGQVNRVEEGRNGSHLNYCKSGSCRDENRLTVWQHHMELTARVALIWYFWFISG